LSGKEFQEDGAATANTW